MRINDQKDVVVMLKVRANLYSLASYYAQIDFDRANCRPRFHRLDGPPGFRRYTMSSESREANRYWHMSEENVWSKEDEAAIKRFYNVKRKSGDIAKAIAWEKPTFAVRPTVNWWRAKLHGFV